MTAKQAEPLGKPLLEIDRKALKLFKPFARTMPGQALDKLCKLTDQPELRVFCAGLFALGAARRDARMMAAAARMLAAHEAANLIKGALKRRVDRRRPRSTDGHRPSKPHKGRSVAKEDQSFPSGHSAGGMAVACAYASVYPERAVPAIAAVSAISASRVVVAAHYPSDVVAGTAVGIGANAALGLALRGLRKMALAALR